MLKLREFTQLEMGFVGKAELMILPTEKGEKVIYKSYNKIYEAVEEFGNYNLIQIFNGPNATDYVIFKPKS